MKKNGQKIPKFGKMIKLLIKEINNSKQEKQRKAQAESQSLKGKFESINRKITHQRNRKLKILMKETSLE